MSYFEYVPGIYVPWVLNGAISHQYYSITVPGTYTKRNFAISYAYVNHHATYNHLSFWIIYTLVYCAPVHPYDTHAYSCHSNIFIYLYVPGMCILCTTCIILLWTMDTNINPSFYSVRTLYLFVDSIINNIYSWCALCCWYTTAVRGTYYVPVRRHRSDLLDGHRSAADAVDRGTHDAIWPLPHHLQVVVALGNLHAGTETAGAHVCTYIVNTIVNKDAGDFLPSSLSKTEDKRQGSLQVTIKTNLLAELKHQAPN